MKFSKIAVLLCGDFRAWPRASEYLFEYFEPLADNIDYYFATWSTTRDYWWPEHKSETTERVVTAQQLTEKFADKNLVGYTIVDQSVLPRYNLTFYYQSYLALQANKLKCQNELKNNFVYDQVIEIRPDLYIRHRDIANELTPCADNEYVAGELFFNNDLQLEQINDFYSRSSSAGNNIISQRFYYRNDEDPETKINNHWLVLEYLRTSNMMPNQSCPNLGDSIPIRPNFPQDNLNNYSMEYLKQLDKDWIAYQWQ